MTDSMTNRWVAYTDGACAPTNPGPAAWGVVVFAPDGAETAADNGFIGPGPNQIAEITAAIEGVSPRPEGAAVELVSDSQYVLKGLSEWRTGWERRGFRNAKGDPVANLELWKRLFAVADARKVSVRWVRGHQGNVNNERADRLAVAALQKARGGA
jgi:ribonuclease H